ncbi:MAG: dihydropteroate synthase [Candidatus Peregrinibacteria bacterium]
MSLPLLMGILNITPNSFSDGGMFVNPQKALERAEEMMRQGADIIDMGSESTAPGNASISAEEEWERLQDILPTLLEKKMPISLDTKKASIAEKFFALGGTILNDVSGLQEDQEEKIALLKKYPQTNLICMFSRNLSTLPDFLEGEEAKIWDEILPFFQEKIALFASHGIAKKRLIIDPGMGGFISKNPAVSFEILKNLSQLQVFGLPILVGTSRKSFLRAVSDPVNPQNRLIASVVSSLLAAQNGAHILRVHDVQETKEAWETWRKMQ